MAENRDQNWPDMFISLYDRLTGRNAEITYDFENLKVEIPSEASEDAAPVPWTFNGKLKIRTREVRK
ncbi:MULTISPECIES: hypothetical protein [Desulfosediminicola]|uniref:hypothetical protein n=1 Tax=Desulfosediminicola TaxID=2886823 RepID=UPI0010AC1CAC|nr:hypothetical protein [Desulfosediminicola ganghwensis]